MTSLSFADFVHEIWGGKFFTITFLKRKTGELRTINCRINADNKLKGGELPYVPMNKDLMVVWDIPNKGFRQIPIEGIQTLSMDGKKYKYNNETMEFMEG